MVINQGKPKVVVVVVEFLHSASGQPTGKDYDFLCTSNLPIVHNSVVVVDTQYGLHLARVVGVKESSRKAHRWVVDVVDTSMYELRKQNMIKKQQLEQALKARAAAISEKERYRIMAQNDETMAALLTELEKLEGDDITPVLAWE